MHKVAQEIFDKPTRSEVQGTAADILNSVVPGKVTLEGIRSNVETCPCIPLPGWAAMCIPLNYLMEGATWVQLWQWVHYAQRIADDGRVITVEMIDKVAEEVKPGLDNLFRGLKQEDCGGIFERTDQEAVAE